jgi:hypothetical protein
MPYLDKAGTEELWSKIKSNFAHDITTSSLTTKGITISLNSGMKNSGNWVQLATADIPAATNTTGGLVTDAQAKSIASIQTYTAGTNISISGGQISVTGLATVATTGKYSDLTDKPTIDTSMSSTSTNAVTNAAISSALSGKANTSHTHTKSQITDFPTSLKNPNALTIGDVTYDGSAAKSITAGDNVTISNGKISATDTTYSAATTSTSGLMSSTDKTKLDGVAEGAKDNIYIAQYGSDTIATIREQQGLGKLIFAEWYSMGYTFPICYEESDEIVFGGYTFGYACVTLTVTSSGWTNTKIGLNAFAPLASPTLTGTPKAPTAAAGTNTEQIATTAFVKSAIDASGAGVVHYKGAATSTASLVNYVTGDYWVASATFALGDETVESGDMIFANKTASAYAAANFDVVQANITAMTTAEVDAICTLD